VALGKELEMKKQLMLIGVLLAVLLLGACRAVDATPPGAGAVAGQDPATLTVATHDSFAVSEEVVAAFERTNNVRLQFLSLGDAGEALNKIILSKDAPLADLFFGVDNTFLSRALKAGVFVPYASPQLEQVPDDLELDAEHRLLPIDFGYVALNADPAWFEEKGLALPQTLEDLTKPEYKGLLVVQNPATSSPGLAFLLTTIGHFGEDGYLDFWQRLKENDVRVTGGWTEAYYEHFTVGSAGAGDRPLVVSYTSSPPADVVFATDGRTEPASINLALPNSAFRQVEFAGILAGTEQPELAQRFLDYMLDLPFQEDIPLQMFVYPANANAEVPALFTQFAPVPGDPVEVAPETIDANREKWVQAWADVMLR
jgi:thiamine transport system substrate-binding protein